eukprot:14317256-Heterocapsa_arctica.AAC.1
MASLGSLEQDEPENEHMPERGRLGLGVTMNGATKPRACCRRRGHRRGLCHRSRQGRLTGRPGAIDAAGRAKAAIE